MQPPCATDESRDPSPHAPRAERGTQRHERHPLGRRLFLISYLTYHLQVGTTRFPGRGWIRPVYFTLLGTHAVLAATIPPLAIATLTFALGARFARHARLARWTLPLWFYVSVTGVAIYVMLYMIYRPA